MIGVLLQSGGDLTAIANGVNIVWVMIASFLIFFMQPGFALLEAGQVRTKNVANVLMKNVMDWSFGVIVYFVVGLAVAGLAGYITTSGEAFNIAGAFAYMSDPGSWITSWLFGAVFAMTAATIVSGAVAERISFKSYVVYSIAITAVIYPVIQGFAWGGDGLLSSSGYIGSALGVGYMDFAGATVVHMLGGVAGLVGAYMVGPRRGRFDSEGKSIPIPGHSIVFAVLGTLILAFGWYGFNVGTQATVLSVENGALAFAGDALGRVALNTTLAMGAGAVGAMLVTIWTEGKPDPLFTVNGLLAGLVAITGACAHVTWWGGLLIGLIGGAQTPLVFRWVVDSLGIDDVCGVFSVHGSAGAIGTFLIPFFGVASGSGGVAILGDAWSFLGWNQVAMQAIGIVVIAVWTVVTTAIVFGAADSVFGLHVSEDEEQEGLDRGEHGMAAYPEFAIDTGEGVTGPTTVTDGSGEIRTDGGSGFNFEETERTGNHD